MRIAPESISWLQVMADAPEMGVKVTAAGIGISRVTLWRLLTKYQASDRTFRRLSAFSETTATIQFLKRKGLQCILKA